MAEKFCKKYKKLKHKMFAGLSLWKECLGIKIRLNPNPLAWQEMKIYNNHDVLSTEELYVNTQGWSKANAPAVYEGDSTRLCRYCGQYTLRKRGTEGNYHKMRCANRACGKWCKGEKIK